MPPRPYCKVPRFSVTDFPIPPFLAPRAFASWSQALGTRRRHRSDVPQDHTSERRSDRTSNPDRKESSTSSSFIDEDDALQDPAEQWVEHLAKNQEKSTKCHVRHKLNLGILHIDPDDDFQSKFDKVWNYAHHKGPEITALKATEHDSIAAVDIQEVVVPPKPLDVGLETERNSTIRPARSTKGDLKKELLQRRQRTTQRDVARHYREPVTAQKSRVRITPPPKKQTQKQESKIPNFTISGLRGFRRPAPPKHPHIDLPRYMLTKFVKVPLSGQLRYAPNWNRRFRLLIHPYESVSVNDSLAEEDLPYDTAVQQLAENMLKCDSIRDIEQLWQGADPHTQEQWDSMILWALKINPLKTLDVLVATSDEYCPRHVIVDALEFIVVSHFVPKGAAKSPVVRHGVANQILEGIQQMLTMRLDINLTQRTIFRLLRNLDGPRCAMFFDFLESQELPLHTNTVLQFAWHLAKEGEIETATRAFELMCSFGGDPNTPLTKRIYSVILANRHRSQTSGCSDLELFARFHVLGVQPDLVMFNNAIRNALHSGDLEVAWNIHSIMENNGVQADAYTYSHFLRYTKSSGDQGSLQKIVESIRAKGLINDYIATDLVHTVFFIYKRQLEETNRVVRRLKAAYSSRGARGHDLCWPATPFRTMLSIYSEYFDIQPLKDLVPRYIAVNKTAIREPKPGTVLMQPADQTLNIMLVGLLQDITYPKALRLLYQDIKTLISAGHPVALRLAKTEHMYNALLISISKHSSLLPLCTEILRDMLGISMSSEPAAANEEHNPRESSSDFYETGSAKFEIAKPTIRTWNILLKVFLDRGQPRAGEKVLETMRVHGVEPNVVTYNTLVDSYARHQDIEMAVDVIRRLREENLEPDDATMKSLSRILDRGALNMALDNLVYVEADEAGKM